MRLEAILSQSQAFLRRFLYGLPLNRDGFPSFSATKMVAKLVDPAAFAVGVHNRRQVASMEAGQEDTLLGDPSMETHLAFRKVGKVLPKRIEKVSSSRSIYKAPWCALWQFVAVSPKKLAEILYCFEGL